ncbi:DUF488 domain-containing protein [Aquisalimonas sp. 2447]|uniref:DUF488 domain-containing protein n=1 Tax=Aquisalimonas sp. 2447 TaxID=2740807 RepID=UPI0014326992|nr:DUF488 domain-containing protein [Aquisalimonas sp. 2447]QIT54534.1 DUF488 domain-containing protein [Aquisalimonas sp. 2447]
MQRLVTIGYERATMEAFLQALQVAGIDVLVDVRQAPVSRRAGFSRRQLADALAASGIEYRHEGALGAPKPIRDAVKAGGDYATFFQAYEAHLATRSDRVDGLVSDLADSSVALMCYERDVAICHRGTVAREIGRRTGLEPVHLQP